MPGVFAIAEVVSRRRARARTYRREGGILTYRQ